MLLVITVCVCAVSFLVLNGCEVGQCGSSGLLARLKLGGSIGRLSVLCS